MSNELLRALVDLRDRQIQKGRIQFGNRVSALERGADNGHGPQLLIAEKWAERFAQIEVELDTDIAKEVANYPIYEYVSEVKGIGPMLAAKMIAMIDIGNSPTISALWRYSGYAVIDGERERPVKGEKLHYNKRLKSTLYLIGSSFLKCSSPYRSIYDSAKEYYVANRTNRQDGEEDWTKLHIHRAAMRKMVKIFLSHLWVTWRQLEGLPISMPYVHAKLAHEHYYEPEEFGWTPIASELEIG